MVQRELHPSRPPDGGALRRPHLARSHLRKLRADDLFELGLRYSTGQSPDLVAAHKWFNLAAMQGMRRAKVERTELAQIMTAREIAEAQRQAREWLARH